MRRSLFTVLLSLALLPSLLAGEADAFGESPPGTDGKGLVISGRFSGEYGGLFIAPVLPQFLLDFYRYARNDFTHSISFGLELDASYATESLDVHLETQTAVTTDDLVFMFDEIRGVIVLSPNLSFGIGRIRYNWGKGYAFSAVGFVNPVKDPRFPDERKAGRLSLEAEFVLSPPSDVFPFFQASLIVLPDDLEAGGTFRVEDLDFAAKLTALVAGIDVDVIGYYGSTGEHKVGADLAFNLLDNLEIHAEGMYSPRTLKTVFGGASPATIATDCWQLLSGLRFLTGWNMTIVLEFFHNGAGYSPAEYDAMLDYIEAAMNSGSQAQVGAARTQTMPVLSRFAAMQNYLYLKIIQPEPFALLYFTPSLYLLWNLDDLSIIAGASFLYEPLDNFNISLTVETAWGSEGSEMVSKAALIHLVFKAGFYF